MKSENTITVDRALEILEAYGASPTRWPEAERAAMLDFMAREPEVFDKAQAEEAALDALLGSGHVQPSDMLERRIMRRLPSTGGRTVRGGAGWSWRAPAAAAAAVLLAVSVGVGGGFFGSVSEEPDLETLYADALDSYGYDWSDWYGPESDGS